MAEVIVQGTNDGASILSTLAAAVSIDLTAYIGRYVKIRGSADFRCVFRPDATPTFDATIGLPARSPNVPEEVDAGRVGVHRLVTAEDPHLTLQGLTADSNVTIKPTSQVAGHVASVGSRHPVIPALPAGPVLLMDAYGVQTSGGEVTRLLDKSGQGNHAIPVATGVVPEYEPLGGPDGTKPAIHFRGDVRPEILRTIKPVSMVGPRMGITIMVLHSLRVLQNQHLVEMSADAFTPQGSVVASVNYTPGAGSPAEQISVLDNAANFAMTSSLPEPGPIADRWLITTTTYDLRAQEGAVFFDGEDIGGQVTFDDMVGGFGDHPWYIGGRGDVGFLAPTVGRISQLVAWARVLDTDELAAATAHLTGRWGL